MEACHCRPSVRQIVLALRFCALWVAGLSWPPNVFYGINSKRRKASFAGLAGGNDGSPQASSPVSSVLCLHVLFRCHNCRSSFGCLLTPFILRALFDYIDYICSSCAAGRSLGLQC